ncbi:cytochrome P450, partial [Wolfiporia cocos MD-104 SS10]
LPLGPNPLLLLRNVHQVPMEHQCKMSHHWAKQYGDVLYLWLFSKSAVVLSSIQAAHDLLEKRSSKYSHRPHFMLIYNMMGWHSNLALMPYGDRWHLHRKWFHSSFNEGKVVEEYCSIQQR